MCLFANLECLRTEQGEKAGENKKRSYLFFFFLIFLSAKPKKIHIAEISEERWEGAG